ncbi:MAG: hypothetical protein ABGW78_03025 [Pirellulales bacterium]
MNAENWHLAKLCFERARQLGVVSNQDLFSLAKATALTRDELRTVAVLAQLAPDDRSVYAPAHMWQAVSLLQDGHCSADDLISVELHLRHVLSLAPTHEMANALLGELYFQQEFWDGAVNCLSFAPRSQTKYGVLLSKACVQTGRRAQAEFAALTVIRISSDAAGRDPMDHESRRHWAEMLVVLERFPEAVDVLAEGIRIEEDDQENHNALARTYLSWSDKLMEDTGPLEIRRINSFRLIAKAMEHNPDNPWLFNRMMEVISFEDDLAAEAREFLRQNLARGHAIGMSHLLLGTFLEKTKDSAQADFHFEQASRLMPTAAIVANNFAWHLAHQPNPDLNRAFSLIQTVIAKHPDNAAYIDTRANIYLGMKKWSLALADFQISLTKYSHEPSVHDGLARAYSELQMTDLAKTHEKTAKRLKDGAQKDGLRAKPE